MEFDFETVSSVTVRTKPLDMMVEAKPKTVLKIDVEGFEYRVLLGAKRHLAMNDCRLLIEIHGWGDKEINKYPFDVLWLLFKLVFSPSRCGAAHYIFEKRPISSRCLGMLRCGPVQLLKSSIRRYGGREVILSNSIYDRSSAQAVERH